MFYFFILCQFASYFNEMHFHLKCHSETFPNWQFKSDPELFFFPTIKEGSSNWSFYCYCVLARQHARMLVPYHLLSSWCHECFEAKQWPRFLSTSDGGWREGLRSRLRLGGGACSRGWWFTGRGFCENSPPLIILKCDYMWSRKPR